MSLTSRQRQFVDSYVRHGNGQVAAVEAGYSRERARQAAHELLSNEAVTAEIERRQTKASLAELTKSSKDITDEYVLGLIVKQISAIEDHGLGGWQVAGLAKFIEMLARYRGMFADRLEVDLGSNIMEKLLEGRQRAARTRDSEDFAGRATRMMDTQETDPRLALAQDISRFYDNPLGFVLYVFPWNKPGLLEHHAGPDKWQADFLQRLGEEVRRRKFNGRDPVAPVRMCVVSGHGIGKSVLAAWLVLWLMGTRPHCRGVVTASTFLQLNTRTWSAVSQWLKMSLIADWFEISSDRLWFKGQKEAWFTTAQTALEQNSESFAGIHAASSSPFVIVDESSGVPDKIFEVSMGATTDGEPFVIALGNPTRKDGWFYRAAFGSDRSRWIRFSVDSRESKFSNKQLLAEWIEDFGLDSDFVRVRILGEAPKASFSAFIGHDIVSACRKYKAQSYEHMPRILGVDVARQGDDRSAIVCRQGRKVRLLALYRGLDTVELAHRVMEFIESEKPVAAVVVDATGMGVGTVDELKHCGYSRYVHEFMAGGKATDPNAHANKRAEAWSLMRDALKAGLEIPDSADWETDLCGTEYGFNPKGAILLEPKDAMKSRGLSSPDLADALSMTFSVRVAPSYHITVSTPRNYSPGLEGQQWMRG